MIGISVTDKFGSQLYLEPMALSKILHWTMTFPISKLDSSIYLYFLKYPRIRKKRYGITIFYYFKNNIKENEL
jgi:hypothetical protein